MQALQVLRLGLQHADGQPADDRRDQVLEPAEDGRGERRHDEQRVGHGNQWHDRGDEDAGEPGDQGADDPVQGGDAVGREAAEVGALLGLGRGTCRQAEPGEPVQRAQRQRHGQDGQREVDAVGRDPEGAVRPEPGRVDRLDGQRGRAEPGGGETGEDHRHADRRDGPRDRWGGPQRPEHDQVQQEPEHAGDRQGEGHRRGQPELRTQVDGLRQPGDEDHELALAQQGVGVGRVEGEPAGREVDDPRAAVGHHQREGEGGEHRAVPDAQAQEDQMLNHVRPFDAHPGSAGAHRLRAAGCGSRRGQAGAIGKPQEPGLVDAARG